MGGKVERTDPDLWERVKRELMKSEKGGKRDQWSARKAQLAVQAYQKRGGGYRGKKPKDTSLDEWTKEEWGTKSGEKSLKTGERYLPKEARNELSKEEYRATSMKKRRDLRRGKQHSAQPEKIAKKTAKHRRGGKAEHGEPTKAELYEEAKRRDIPGRSTMNRAELERALEHRVAEELT
jgi:hypothetical protein